MGAVLVTKTFNNPVQAAKKAVEVYVILNNIKYSQRLLFLMAYYCLYGVSRKAEELFKDEFLVKTSENMTKQIINNLRHALYKKGLIIRSIYTTTEYTVNPHLRDQLTDLDKFTYVIKFSVNEETRASI